MISNKTKYKLLYKKPTIDLTTDRIKVSEQKNSITENYEEKHDRKDAFGNLISKNCKYHISFIDQISNNKLVDICFIENNEPIVFEQKKFINCQSCNIF